MQGDGSYRQGQNNWGRDPLGRAYMCQITMAIGTKSEDALDNAECKYNLSCVKLVSNCKSFYYP